MNQNRFKKSGHLIKLLFIATSIAALLSLVVMLLWNGILHRLLPVGAVSYWQSAGLLILCKLLFGGFRFGGFGYRGRRLQTAEKFMSMTAEERENLKAQWQKRCQQRKQQNK